MATSETSDPVLEVKAREGHWKLPAVVIAAGAAVHLAFFFQVFHLKSFSGLWFVVVVLMPWLVLLASLRLAAGRKRMNQIGAIVGAAYLLLGAWTYWDTIYVHPDPQGGLVFFVLPAIGTIAAIAWVLVLVATRKRY